MPGDYQENPHTTAIGPDPQCAGATFTVHVTNPDFLAVGGSPFEGQTRHLCDAKLFHINAGQSIAPNFHFFTDVPIATFFTGLIVDDVNVTTDKKSTGLGEVRGLNNAPTGVYDWTGQLIDTVNSDYNGIWEALEPSSDITNCFTPSGVCPNVYRFVGNDPGQPGKPNTNYQPGYRTISANFQAWPGNFVPADTAPTMAAASIQAPGAQFSNLAQCKAASTQPVLMAVDNPYVVRNGTNLTNTTLTIDGQGFGAVAGNVALYNEASSTTTPVFTWTGVSWNDTHIVVHSTSGNHLPAVGDYELRITANGGLHTTNALTYHVVNSSTNVILVGHSSTGAAPNGAAFNYDPTKTYDTVAHGASPRALGLGAIQQAIEKATDVQLTGPNSGRTNSLIVVYPAPTAAFTPLGTYYENLVVHSAVKIQGVGPGGLLTDGTAVQGTILDGRYFWTATTTNGSGSAASQNEAYALAWEGLVTAIGQWDGFAPMTAGADVYVVARQNSATSTIGTFRTGYKAGIDGFTLQGGDQRDFPGNITELGGAKTGPSTGVVETQGGAVFVNAYANYFTISNNLIQSQQRLVRRDPRRHRVRQPAGFGQRSQPDQRPRPDRAQPDLRQRRHEPGWRSRPVLRLDELPGHRQHLLRQLVDRVRRRDRPLRQQRWRRDRPQQDLPELVDRRGWRDHDRRRSAASEPGRHGAQRLARLRVGHDRPQRHRSQPRQRRRWRYQAPHGRRLQGLHQRQHHHQQRLHP